MRRRISSSRPALIALAILLSGTVTTTADSELSERITLDLKDVSLQEVFCVYEEFLRVELVIDPALDQSITASFDNITVRTSLNVICESAGCRWEFLDGEPRLLRIDRDDQAPGELTATPAAEARKFSIDVADSTDPRGYTLESYVALELNDADATSVLRVVAKVIGSRLLMDRKLGGERVTVHVKAVPLSTLLDTICLELGCEWKLTGDEPSTLEVYLP